MRWLHISDIHIMSDADDPNKKQFIDDFLAGMKESVEKDPVDCIVFTGDLFHQGKRNKNMMDNALALLRRIYKICSDAGRWRWADGNQMERFFYCPGNHDVFREAHIVTDSAVLYRRDYIKSVTKEGVFAPSEESIRELMTKGTFELFSETVEKLISGKNYDSDYPYEYRLFTFRDATLDASFAVVGINTELNAGCHFDAASWKETMSIARKEFEDADACLDTQKALVAYKKFHNAVLMRDGLLMDEEGKLCFISNNAEKSLADRVKATSIPVIFGHHPYTSLDNNAQNNFFYLFRQLNSRIYLCGHTHKAAGHIMRNSLESSAWTSEDKRIYQIAVGGIFLDNSGYNQASYSIGSVEFINEDKAKLQVAIHVYYRDVFNEMSWQSHSRDEEFVLRMPRKTTENPHNGKQGGEHNPMNSKLDDRILSVI